MTRYAVHLCFGGPIRRMLVNGRYVTFEMHRYLGPIRVHGTTGEPTKRDFAEGSPFWPLFERWVAGGEKVDDRGRCVVESRGE